MLPWGIGIDYRHSMTFEWDEVKAKANLAKHGVGFPLARRVFADVYRLEVAEDGEYDEDRWITVGLVDSQELVVCYTMRGERIRLISARRAEEHERERYWHG
jgi:uncharacterized DUF497 family protein